MFEFKNINTGEIRYFYDVTRVDIVVRDESTLVFENDNQSAYDYLCQDPQEWLSVMFNNKDGLSGRFWSVTSVKN